MIDPIVNTDIDHTSTTQPSSPASNCDPRRKINSVWREKICDWFYAVVDHFDLYRETVCVACSYLDRFIPRYRLEINHKTYQLAAITCLYMAIKLYETRKLSIASFMELSRGNFTVDHIVSMESVILRTLSWQLHPPTPLTFVNHLLLMIPNEPKNSEQIITLHEISLFLTELSVCDYFFVTRKPSSIAMACILNAIDEIKLSPVIVQKFICDLRQNTTLDVTGEEVMECKELLKEMYIAAGAEFYGRDETSSPTTVVETVDVSN